MTISNDMTTCKNCGWVHFAVSRDYIKKQTKEFAAFWNNSSIKTKLLYMPLGTKESDLPERYNEQKHSERYLRCFKCGDSYKNFRKSKEKDSPVGCTIQPILDYKE